MQRENKIITLKREKTIFDKIDCKYKKTYKQ